MVKLDKLSPEQERMMLTHRQEWIDFILKSGKDLTIDEIKDDIGWIYEKMGLKAPLIFIADSYLEEKLMINYIISLGKNPEQLKTLLLNQMHMEMMRQIMYKTTADVWKQLFESIPALKEQVQKQLENTKEIDMSTLNRLIFGENMNGLVHASNEKLNKKVGVQARNETQRLAIDVERLTHNLGNIVRDSTELYMDKLRPENNEQINNQVVGIDDGEHGERRIWKAVDNKASKKQMEKLHDITNGTNDTAIFNSLSLQMQEALAMIGKRNHYKKDIQEFIDANAEKRTGGVRLPNGNKSMIKGVRDNQSNEWSGQVTDKARMALMTELQTIFQNMFDAVGEQDKVKMRQLAATMLADKVRNRFHRSPYEMDISSELQNKVWLTIGRQLSEQLNHIKESLELQTEKIAKNEDVGKIRDKTHNQLIEQTTDMDYNVYNKIYDAIGGNTSTFMDTIRAQITAQVNEELKSQSAYYGVRNNEPEKMDFVEQSMGILYHSWVSFYEYFRRIKVVDERDPANADYITYADFLKKGVWSIQYFTNFVVICKLPKRVRLDDQNRLHSMAGSAIIWRTPDVHNYFIHGVSFPDDLYNKIKDDTITAKELLSIQNQEQKSAAMREIGFDKVIKELGNRARCIDIGRKRIKQNGEWVTLENELYEISGLFRFNMKTVKCRCTSTDRVFYIDVPPEMQNANEAMAWTLDMSKEEYEQMTVET